MGGGIDLERRIMDQRNHMVYTDKLHKDHIFDAYTLNKVGCPYAATGQQERESAASGG